MSHENKLKPLLDKFQNTKMEFLSVALFRKGSISKRTMTCGNPRCPCHSHNANRHGPYYWWTTKDKGQTKALFIPKEFLPEARTYLGNYKKLNRKLKALSQLSERIIQKKLHLMRNDLKRNT